MASPQVRSLTLAAAFTEYISDVTDFIWNFSLNVSITACSLKKNVALNVFTKLLIRYCMTMLQPTHSCDKKITTHSLTRSSDPQIFNFFFAQTNRQPGRNKKKI